MSSRTCGGLIAICRTILQGIFSYLTPTVTGFTYTSLNEKSDQIRLCTLQPGKSSQPLEFSLCVVSLGNAPPFEALSYTWKSGSQIAYIRKEANARKLKHNVVSAMYHLRLEDKQRILWIDCLCINSSHLREKAHQVTLMGEIYKRATRVVVWLGEASQHSTSGIFKISQYASRQRERENPLSCPATSEILILEVDSLALESVFKRPYFHRAWTIQEIAQARTATVQCGQDNAPWQDFVDTSTYLRHAPPGRIASFRSELRCVWNVARISKGISLLALLSNSYRSSHYQCENDHDRIFALLSLAAKPDQIAVDYQMSVADLYTNFVIDSIDTHKRLAVFAHTQQSSRSPELPSWVPDWRKDRFGGAGSAINFNEITEGRSRYRATLDMTQSARYRAPNQLKLMGIVFDTVSTIITTFPREIGGEHHFEDWISRVDDRTSYDCTNEDIHTAYFKVLSTDQSALSSRIDDDYINTYYPEYRRWIRTLDINKQLQETDGSSQKLHYKWTRADFKNMPKGLVKEIWHEIKTQYAHGRYVFHASKGYIGLGPLDMKFGDKICLLFGGSVPYVVRPIKRHIFQLVGECFVHGVMDGEVLQKSDAADFQDITLV
jgi:hypothetical protein